MTVAAEPCPAGAFATTEEAIEEIRQGRMVVVVDDADRENEGDPDHRGGSATPEAVNFMATHGRGLICLCLTLERCAELELRQMTSTTRRRTVRPSPSRSKRGRHHHQVSGARPLAHTIQVAIDLTSGPAHLVHLGHIFPLEARAGACCSARARRRRPSTSRGRRPGPAGVVCEIMNDDGTMARVGDLVGYCERHGLKMVTVADLIEYRRRHRAAR